MKKLTLIISVIISGGLLLTSCASSSSNNDSTLSETLSEKEERKLLKRVTSSDNDEVRFGAIKAPEIVGTTYAIYDDGIDIIRPEYTVDYYEPAIHVNTRYYAGISSWRYDSFDILRSEQHGVAEWTRPGKVSIKSFNTNRQDTVYPECWKETICSDNFADYASAEQKVIDLQRQYKRTGDNPGLYCNTEFRMVITQTEFDHYLEACASNSKYALAGTPTWIVSYGDSSVRIERQVQVAVTEIVVE